MKYAYPIVITSTDGFFVVYIPDFDTGTQGATLAEAMEMARDAIGMCGCLLEDEGRHLPAPSDMSVLTAEKTDTVTLVDVDFTAYRRRRENRTVRKNVTLPSWLNEEAEAAQINFSAVLQKALKQELHING